MAKNIRLFDNDYDEDVVDQQGFKKPFDAEVVDPDKYSMESSAERQVSIGLQFISTDTATYLSRLAFESTHRWIFRIDRFFSFHDFYVSNKLIAQGFGRKSITIAVLHEVRKKRPRRHGIENHWDDGTIP